MHHSWTEHPAAHSIVLACTTGAAVLALTRMLGTASGDGPGYLIDRDSEAGHVIMLTAMAFMLNTPHHNMANMLWRSVFGVLACACGVLLVMRIRDPERAAAAAYHLFSALAMLYTTWGADGPPWPRLGWFMTALLLLDATATTAIAVAGKHRTTIGVALIPHVVMDVVMAFMLVTVL